MSDNEAREKLKRVAEVASVKHLKESIAEYRAVTDSDGPDEWELEFWHAGYKRGVLAMIDHHLALSAQEAATEVEWATGLSGDLESVGEAHDTKERAVAQVDSWNSSDRRERGALFTRTVTSWQEVPADE